MAGLTGHSLLPRAPKDTEGTFQPLCACVWLAGCLRGSWGENDPERSSRDRNQQTGDWLTELVLVLWERLEQEPSSIKLSRARTARLRWGGDLTPPRELFQGSTTFFFFFSPPLSQKSYANPPDTMGEVTPGSPSQWDVAPKSWSKAPPWGCQPGTVSKAQMPNLSSASSVPHNLPPKHKALPGH